MDHKVDMMCVILDNRALFVKEKSSHYRPDDRKRVTKSPVCAGSVVIVLDIWIDGDYTALDIITSDLLVGTVFDSRSVPLFSEGSLFREII